MRYESNTDPVNTSAVTGTTAGSRSSVRSTRMADVILNEAEQRLAQYLAKRRHDAARMDGIPDMKMGPQSAYDTDLEGIAAEIAFCKIMNVYPDTDIVVGTRPISDAYTTSMGSVDVKATKYKNGRLLATTKKQANHPDSYALMVGEFPRYKFVGWVPAEELLMKKNIRDLGHGEGYALDQSMLRKPESEEGEWF